MKALSLTIKSYGQCKTFYRQTNVQTDKMEKQTNRQAKNYMHPIYRCRGIKTCIPNLMLWVLIHLNEMILLSTQYMVFGIVLVDSESHYCSNLEHKIYG